MAHAKDIKEEFERMRDRYKKDAEKQGFNALIYGDFGTGKTYMLHTAPKPVLVHSFDPGGTKSLRTWIEKGDVLVDTQFERDGNSVGDPEAYIAWEKEFNRLRQAGVFEHIGTYVLDSITTMSESMMSAIMVRGTAKGTSRTPYHKDIKTFIPQLQDYLVQQYTLRDLLNVCCGLPCNFIATGHIDRTTDEVSGKIIASPMIAGKYAQKIPMLFDEVYITDVKETSKGSEYRLLTESKGMYRARSRLAASHPIETYEEQNIEEILRKCNYTMKDKPLYLPEEDKQKVS